MIAKTQKAFAVSGLSRRGLVGGFAGTVAAVLIGLPVGATTDPDDDPIELVEGWLLRRSDLEVLDAGRGRHRS